jgi:hypothetical protein
MVDVKGSRKDLCRRSNEFSDRVFDLRDGDMVKKKPVVRGDYGLFSQNPS